MRNSTLLFAAACVLCLGGCTGKTETEALRPVTISTYFEDDFLSESVELFNQANPDTPVELNIYKPTNEDENINEMYAGYISTELMSGKADDIIVLSSLPYYNYYEMLTDFTPYIENSEDFSKGGYYQPLLDTLKTDGKLFMLPVNYSLDILAFNKGYSENFIGEDAVSFTEYNSMGKELIDKNGGPENLSLYDQDSFQMFFWKLQNNYHRFINLEDKTSGGGEFIDMLEEYKALEDGGYIPSAPDFWEGNIPSNVLAKYDAVSNIGLALGLDENFSNAAVVTSDDGEVYYSSDLTLGLNVSSANKEAAWKFIEFLLSDERQRSAQLSALPVNKKALTENTKTKIDMLNQTRREEGKSEYGDADALAQEYAEKIEKWTESVRRYSYFEPAITDMIFEEGQLFFLENKSADDVAEAIDNKARLYLKE